MSSTISKTDLDRTFARFVHAATRKTHRLSDGTTMAVRTERTIAGTYYHEIHSRKRPSYGTLMRLDGSMFLVMRQRFVPISHPDYSYAADDKAGAAKALEFFIDSAEATISHAETEGISVDECY